MFKFNKIARRIYRRRNSVLRR